ncbi:hypothetical protein EYF80_067950 [Liparis tanakae]|uniref:Uncharacterized protein n=1 Tax=Liparis tanakae TaxID=230148 RepID=A0A4Z2DZP2_9TELE|nr:hypothetical protein EYF80_067950 [Liparis tanakae]
MDLRGVQEPLRAWTQRGLKRPPLVVHTGTHLEDPPGGPTWRIHLDPPGGSTGIHLVSVCLEGGDLKL